MNCNETRGLIDSYFDEGKERLSKEVLIHIDSCEVCRTYYHSQLETAEMLTKIKTAPAFLADPISLTDNIMSEIAKDQMHLAADLKPASRRSVVIRWSHRLLAAASIGLLLTFSIEQYIVVNKIVNLEQQLSLISKEAPTIILNKTQIIDFPDFMSDNLLDKPLFKFLMRKKSITSDHQNAKQIQQKRQANDQ